jgi:hypothetical protein
MPFPYYSNNFTVQSGFNFLSSWYLTMVVPAFSVIANQAPILSVELLPDVCAMLRHMVDGQQHFQFQILPHRKQITY